MPGKIGRRRFLETAGRLGAAAVLGSIPLINGCKGGSTTPDEPPEPAVPVDLEFTVYNHTQGPRGTFRRTGVMSGTTVALSVPDLISEFGITDVYDKAICVLESISRIRVASSRVDMGAGFLAPREDTSYDVFLFNVGGQAYYSTAGTSAMPLQFGPKPRTFRTDNGFLGGEESVWGGEFVPEIGEFGVFDQYNKALKPEWASWSYGHIERKPAPNDNTGEFAYGFGDCNGRDSGAFFAGVFFPVMWAGIDPTRVPDIRGQVSHGLGIVADALFSIAMGIRLEGRFVHSWQVVQENGILTEVFRNFLSYSFLLA